MSCHVMSCHVMCTDALNYTLDISKSDYFIAVYDESGNLKRITISGQNTESFSTQEFVNFFKGDGDYFYLAKNLNYYIDVDSFVDFGQVIPQTNNIDGTILRLTEGCGIMKYNRNFLSNQEFDKNALFSIYPNPTVNKFQVTLNRTYENITLEIYDVYGKRITTEVHRNVNKIESILTGSEGMYFVKIITNEKEVTWGKLLKK